MKNLILQCVKCEKTYPYEPKLFTCRLCNSAGFTNLIVKDPHNELAETADEKTPCYKIPELNKIAGLPNLFIKDETFNRFGTMKDRRSKALVKLAEQFNFKKIFCVTGGNLGSSLGEFAIKSGIECISVAPKDIPKKILAKLAGKTTLTEIETLFDPTQVWTSQKVAAEFPDALDGTSNNPVTVAAYHGIISELMGLLPEIIIVPLGSGELFCGLCQKIEESKMGTKVIGVSVIGKNPIWPAIQNNKDEIQMEKGFQERSANKISVMFTPLLPVIMHYLSKGHKFIEISSTEMQDAIFEFQPYFEHAIEHSSFSVFAAAGKLQAEERGKKIACILTGRTHANEALRHI